MNMRRVVAISDFCTRVPPDPVTTSFCDAALSVRLNADVAVTGGYLERLPLACVRHGIADAAEVWSFTGSDADTVGLTPSPHSVGLRRFRADGHTAPYGSAQMMRHIRTVGAPDILCFWGLGVTPDVFAACPNAVTIYNSLDVDALRIPFEISRHIGIFLTASEAQTKVVRALHPDALIEMLPIGPEFASPETFFPMGIEKDFELIYVAAAQPYKRHDILFNALAELPRSISALCVFGYGENADALRRQAAEMGLNVTFVGPPGVGHAEVNRLMNRARIGVVCGRNDGAPAILTEYMLAGLPVLANADLCCGLKYIRPDTGRTASATNFAQAIVDMLADSAIYQPRKAVLDNWAWPHSIKRLAALIERASASRQELRRA